MNSKLLGYEEAVAELKVLEREQRSAKKYRKLRNEVAKKGLQIIRNRKVKEINLLLSLIAAHKKARRMYGLLQHTLYSLDDINILMKVKDLIKYDSKND